MDDFMDFKIKKMTKLKTFRFKSKLCQDYFKEASSASIQLNFNSTQLQLIELGTTQLKLVDTYKLKIRISLLCMQKYIHHNLWLISILMNSI